MKVDFQVVAANYWLEVRNDLVSILQELKHALLLIHNSAEFEDLIPIYNQLPFTHKIVYISLTKTAGSILPFTSKLKPDIFVVDCVSGGLFVSRPPKNCSFEPAPDSLEGLRGLIHKFCDRLVPEFVVVDGFSQYINFSQDFAPDFLKLFLAQLKSIHEYSKCRIILLYDDFRTEKLLNLPIFDVDVLRAEFFRDKVEWKD